MSQEDDIFEYEENLGYLWRYQGLKENIKQLSYEKNLLNKTTEILGAESNEKELNLLSQIEQPKIVYNNLNLLDWDAELSLLKEDVALLNSKYLKVE